MSNKTGKKTGKKFNNILIVDGQNVLKHPKGKCNPRNIEIVRKWAKQYGIQPFFIFPKYREYQELLDNTIDIVFVNRWKHDDITILELARDCNAAILSNDQFREFRSKFQNIDFDKVFSFSISMGDLHTLATGYFSSPFFFSSTHKKLKNIQGAA